MKRPAPASVTAKTPSSIGINRVAIIGLGHVGENVRDRIAPRGGVGAQDATATEIVTYDVGWDVPYPTEALDRCELAIICVPTPSLENGECDTTIVEKAVAAVPVDLVWVRSTVPPGTCDTLAERYGKRVCFSPEYVGETHFSDAYDLDEFLIVGGQSTDRTAIIDFARRCSPAPTRIYECTNAEAELVKYMENSFLAAKVGIVAEFYELSQKLGLDWAVVREAWLADPRIGRAHSHAVIDDLGFGGKCLPKDVAALCAFAEQAGAPLDVLERVRDANQARRA